jgi:AcrR family transcriptional regulator
MAPRRPDPPAERARRRHDLLDAATWLLDRWSVSEVTMDRIAGRAGVAKGTLYRYFRTREELLLAIWENEHRLWLEDFRRRLADDGGRLTARGVGLAIARSALARPRLSVLHGRVRSELEHNLPLAVVRALKQRELDRLADTAVNLAERFPSLHAATARRWLMGVDAVAAGLLPHASPAAVVARVLELPPLRLLRLDPEPELARLAELSLLDLIGEGA